MTLVSGTRIGVFEITGSLGAGGMGEVYRARDTRLQRDVALKILPDVFAADPDRLARFEREAQVLASLNHPHIAAIHGLEESNDIRALVLELVEGDTLADRITRAEITGSRASGLPVDEALSIARQIADALEAAHEHGVIHRDLKPANIKIAQHGSVKVLDFGLAKTIAQPAAGPGVSQSPTITTPAMTQAGIILGTAAYMSPEQAKGREADKRSDVWAFGCVLYEMLTGRRAFDGEDTSDTLASVLRSDPDWTLLPRDVPHAIRTLMQRCLVKDHRRRVSEMSTAKFILIELGGISEPRAAATADAGTTTPSSRWHWVLPAGAAAALTAIIVGAGTWMLWPNPRPPDVARLGFTLPEGQRFTGAILQMVAISPDGRRLAYVANQRLYVRAINEMESTSIAGIDTSELSALHPMFAPDGQSIAYLSGAATSRTALMRIPISGGTPSTITPVESFYGASWSADGILIGQQGGILSASPDGGAPKRVISVAADEVAHRPQLLPDGHTVLFTLAKRTGDDRWDTARVVAQSLVDGTRHILKDGGADARYLQSGHLIYAVGATMFAVPFDAGSLRVTGSPVPVVVGVRRAVTVNQGSAQLEVSDTGTLVYVPGPATPVSTLRGLALGDDHSNPVLLKIPPGSYVHPRVSPNGKILAVGRNDGAATDIWTYDLSGKSEIKRLTFESNNRFPVWSADSRRLTFQSAREGDRAIWWQSADSGTAERLTKPAQDEEHVPESWSQDGLRLLFSVVTRSSYSLWVFTLDGKKIEPFGQVQSAEPFSASFSPDGRWVAYASTASLPGSGNSPNRGVFVEPFPPTGRKDQAPKTLIDYHPVWAPDGKSLFYVPSSIRPTVSVPVTTQPSVSFGTPVELARAPRPGLTSLDMRGYDVLPDGRFISLAPAPGENPAAAPTNEVRVVLNWFEELKRLVPKN